MSALSAGDRHAPKGHMATVSIWAVLPLGTDGSSSIGAQGMRSGTIASLRVSPWKNRSAHALGRNAAQIRLANGTRPGRVVMRTVLSGQGPVDILVGE
ncbi:hypothetical protein ACMAY7_01190 [Rhodobacteraceae bacterium nBUS_24]